MINAQYNRIRNKIVNSEWYGVAVPKEFQWAVENAQCYRMVASSDPVNACLVRSYEVISGCHCFNIKESRVVGSNNESIRVTFTRQTANLNILKIRNNISF